MNVQTSLEQERLPEEGEPRFQSDAGAQLVDLVRVIRVRSRLIVGTAAVAMAITIVVLFQLTPLYSAQAVVMLDQRKNNVEDVSAVLSGLPTDPTSIQNQVQILTSRKLASRVIDRLKLDQDPEFNGSLSFGWSKLFASILPSNLFGRGVSMQTASETADMQKDQTIDEFLRHLGIDTIGLSTAITVSFNSRDGQKAARITNTIADEYVEDQLDAKFEATQRATQWLSGRIQQLSGQVQAADVAVQQYKAENNLSETADGASIVEQQLGSVSGQLILAKSDLAQKQAIYDQVMSLDRAGRAADLSQVVASPVIAQLRGQETDLGRQEADLLTQFGPRHPKILQLESEKKNLENKIAEEVNRVVESVKSDVAVSGANMSSLQASLSQLESRSQSESKATVRLKALEGAAATSRSMYEAYLSRLKEAQGQEGIQTPDARVISAAEAPESPSFPRKTLVLGAALPLSLALGLMLAFAAERLDSGFRTSAQVESTLGLPVLATIPEIKGAARNETINAADRIVDKPLSAFAEAIRGLQLGLSLSNVDHEPHVIMVTSSVPGEGKTTIAASLARLAARGGKKVVIVDCDLRSPRVAATMGLDAPAVGVLDALSGKQTLDKCLIKDPRSSAFVLPCTEKPSNPSDILGSESMAKLISSLRQAFDLVIIDSAPLLPVHDSKILSRLADTALFVVHWEKTPRDASLNAIRALMDSKVAIAGVALARADAKRFQQYNYGYQSYNNYNKYYSE